MLYWGSFSGKAYLSRLSGVAMQAALRSCSTGGKVVLVGMGDELMKLDMTHAATHEIDIIGSFRYANTVRAPPPPPPPREAS